MVHFQIKGMELSHFFHACLQVIRIISITDSGVFQELSNLVTIFRVDVGDVIADPSALNYLVDLCFFPSVYELVRTLTRNTHDVFLIPAGKEE